MSTGAHTTRAQLRDDEIRRQVLSAGDHEWRSPEGWRYTLRPTAAAFYWWGGRINRATVYNELRRMEEQGLVEYRVNPADGRSVQFRRASHL